MSLAIARARRIAASGVSISATNAICKRRRPSGQVWHAAILGMLPVVEPSFPSRHVRSRDLVLVEADLRGQAAHEPADIDPSIRQILVPFLLERRQARDRDLRSLRDLLQRDALLLSHLAEERAGED